MSGNFPVLEGTKEQNLLNDAKVDQNKMNIFKLSINNQNFTENELKSYSVLTDVFNETFADNGLFGVVNGGPTLAAAGGYYVITEPLSKGTYLISTAGESCLNGVNACPLANDFNTYVTTKLIVE